MNARDPMIGIEGDDLMRPVEDLIEEIRSDLRRARGRLSDIAHAHPGWRENMEMVEGLLTCGLVTLHWVREQMVEHRRRVPPDLEQEHDACLSRLDALGRGR